MAPVFRIAAAEGLLLIAAAVAVFVGSEDADRGDFGRAAAPLPFATLRKGDAVRLVAFAGVPVRDGGLEGRLIVGLSHDEKKSSSGSPDGVLVPAAASSAAPSIMTSSGYLGHVSTQLMTFEKRILLTASDQPLLAGSAPPCTS